MGDGAPAIGLASTAGARPSSARLLWSQVKYQNRLFWRSPVSAFFTIVLPLILLVLFGSIFGAEDVGGGFTVAQFYAPSLAVFGAVSATYTNLGIRTTFARDEGVLKRIRGTPLPPPLYMGGAIGSAVYIATIAAVVMLAYGVVVYGLVIHLEAIPALVVTFLVGVSCFAALGLLVAALAPSGEAASAITNATLLPLAFISEIFIITGDDMPAVLSFIADIFPLKHFATAFRAGFDPEFVATTDSWLDFFQWGDLAVMLIWTVIGVVLTLRWFSWEPRATEGRRKRRKAKSDA
jgi:ABC-2 type transport system permease protein